MEKLPLGSVVDLHCAVEIEVVPGQVREDGAGEARLSDALEGYAVRGDLHDHPADAGLEHRGERPLHLCSLWRRPDRGTALAARDGLGGRHETELAFSVGPGQDSIQNIRRGGLAVRTGDAVDPHATRRVSVYLPGKRRESGPRVPHDRGRDTGNVTLGDHE